MSPDGKQLRLGPGADFRTINAAPVEVYSFKDSTYVLAALNGNPALFKLLQDSVDTECVFHDQPISRVKTLYPLDGPVRDPAKRRD